MWGLSIVGSGGFLWHIHFGYWVSYLPCWLRTALFLLVNVVVSEYPEGLNLREQRVEKTRGFNLSSSRRPRISIAFLPRGSVREMLELLDEIT